MCRRHNRAGAKLKNRVTQVRRLAQHIFHRLPRLTGPSFIKDERGNFAMITALVLVPLLLAGMIAVDSANLMRVRNNVQASLDVIINREHADAADQLIALAQQRMDEFHA